MGARILLNIDLGELPNEPEALYASAHVANIACGGHAGDDASMQRAIVLCDRHGVLIGAHPSYPDRPGFGRRRLAMTPDAVRATVADQCSRLAAMALARHHTVAFVKPHGALYHAARDDAATARAVVAGSVQALGRGVTMVGPPTGALLDEARRAQIAFAREGFADRTTREDGTLVPRDEPGAIVLDPAIAATRAGALVARGEVDTVCVHGDTPGAVVIAQAVRATLDALAGASGR
jgi:UPF0271 protein